MAPSSPSNSSLQPLSTAENDLQPFFVLHKASHQWKDRTSAGQGKPRKRNKLSLRSSQSANEPEGSSAEECDRHLCRKMKIEAFDIVWTKIESTIKDVLRDINASVFNDIQQWAMECFDTTRLVGEPSIAEATRSFPVLNNTTPLKLYTALVITRNIEFVDDIMTFEELGLFLKSHGCHVAMLSSMEFSLRNGIAGCLKALLREFLGSSFDSPDIQTLASWYREQDNYNKPLVLIINDLERCCGSVLTDFILMLSEWVVKVPIILVFGVATTVDAPRNIFPSHALECLCPSMFMLGTPAERMDAIVESVFIKHCTTFNIAHKVAQFLRNYFINQDGTVTSFIRALKVACLLHFSMEPLSLVQGRVIVEDQLSNSGLSPETMMKYLEELPSYARNKEVDETKKSMAEGLSELLTVKKLWSTVVLCLYEAGKYSGVRLLDLFCEALNQVLYPSKDSVCNKRDEKDHGLSSSNDPCQQYSIMQSGGCICQIVRKVRDLPSGKLDQLIESWEKLTEDISEIHEKLKILKSSIRCKDGKSSHRNSKDISKRGVSKGSINNDKDSRMSNLQAIAFLDDLVRNYLRPIEGIPFHEIFCFKNVEKLQLVLIGDPRRRIQVDLLEFHNILRCSCCNKSGKALLPSMHDSSIMYSLAQEHGDLINLHDWFQSFRTIVLQHTNKRKQKSKQTPLPKKRQDTSRSEDQNEASIQARFCRGVTELQITGLVRMPSKRRPDFVQRIAFGI
ncbi:origin of replication complex subunit 3-like [Vicia villosa]|uniref:origin of replication complex subunit 3-like n=1 Tax=Vicia villosa TaxID=3911 RepID=UPI00273A7D6D|nr:origin of replication complex subunit 3-like [Vicia villosa]